MTRPGYNYTWEYEAANANRMVVDTRRSNAGFKKDYKLWQVKLGTFQTDPSCQLVSSGPPNNKGVANCDDINNAAIHATIDTSQLGFMLLNGKRLGNLSVIEAIPNESITDFRKSQVLRSARR